MIVGITVSEFRSGVPVSVYKDSWSKEFANAGISSNAFYQNYQTIRSYLGRGRPIPKDTGILYLKNPNSETNDGGGQQANRLLPRPQPNPEPSLPLLHRRCGNVPGRIGNNCYLSVCKI